MSTVDESLLIKDRLTPTIYTITIGNVISDLIKDNIELQNLNEKEQDNIINQATNLSLKILDNISKNAQIIHNVSELREFIKNEIEKISDNLKIAESDEYSNYVIKPNEITLLYYVILLSLDDELLFNFYFNWLNIKKICNSLINIYKINLDNPNEIDFINFFISVNDLFNKFSSPTITELDDDQTGGLSPQFKLITILTFLISLWLLSYGNIINPTPTRVDISKSLIEGPNSAINDWYDKTKYEIGKFFRSSEVFTINWAFDDLAAQYGVSKEQRQLEENKALATTNTLITGLKRASQVDAIRGLAIVVGFSPLTEDRANYASTQIVNHMYDIGLSSGDVYRALDTIDNLLNDIVPCYEKYVEVAKSKKNENPNALDKLKNDIVIGLKSKTINVITDTLLSSAGLQKLKGLKDLLVFSLPNPDTTKNLEINLKLLKETQSDIKTGITAINTIIKFRGEEDILKQKRITYEDPTADWLGGRKSKNTKKNRKQKNGKKSKKTKKNKKIKKSRKIRK